MPTSKFFVDIPVRYGDLDPQGHVNNSRHLTFMEQARMAYLIELGLWNGESFLDLNLIVADAHVVYLAPIFIHQTVRVYTRVARMGNKSLSFEYELVDAATGEALARGDTAMVTYDYRELHSMPIPPDWRARITAYEPAGEQ
ncbi:MAG TPA: thioesterase family protein [Anaerolineaceae bacterium]|jgi:acyl-CoA thioester hydrolase|nr:thioesterase family protein [Anaerolineaceae bacterium]